MSRFFVKLAFLIPAIVLSQGKPFYYFLTNVLKYDAHKPDSSGETLKLWKSCEAIDLIAGFRVMGRL